MNPLKRCTATKWVLLALLLGSSLAQADTAVATVRHLSGALLLQKADGSTRVLTQQSRIEPGDTLRTQKNSYAQIAFNDDSMLTLQPDSTLRVDQFTYESEKPQVDQAIFTLVRGGVRMIQGLMGQRSKERVVLKTPVADVGLQGSALVQFIVPTEQALAVARRDYLLASTAALETDALPKATRSDTQTVAPQMLAQLTLPAAKPGLPPGLYVQVLDGLIFITNPGGTQNFTAGQFGFMPNTLGVPVVLPNNPGIRFTPPPDFSAPTTRLRSNAPATASTVDCEVR